MTFFDFIARFILFVIPGFILYMLFCYLTSRHQASQIIGVAYVFVSSIISFAFGNLLLMLINLFSNHQFLLVDITQILSGQQQVISSSSIIAAVISSVVLGFVAVAIWDNNLLFRLAKLIRITHRIDNCAVWDYMFDAQPWIVFRDYVTGNVYYGRVAKYSDGEAIREIALEDVKVWSKNDGEYTMNLVYISRNPSEFSIEIADYSKERDNDAETDAGTNARTKQESQEQFATSK